MTHIITEVEKYKTGWSSGQPETPCGFGSKIAQTRVQSEWIPDVVSRYGIKSIADIGAGDMNWIKFIKWPHKVDYQPYDLVPRHKLVEPFDIIQSVPEPVDCLMCLWVLNHLPAAHARQALKNLLASGSKYLMYTWWPIMFDFLDIGSIEYVVIRKETNAELRLIEL